MSAATPEVTWPRTADSLPNKNCCNKTRACVDSRRCLCTLLQFFFCFPVERPLSNYFAIWSIGGASPGTRTDILGYMSNRPKQKGTCSSITLNVSLLTNVVQNMTGGHYFDPQNSKYCSYMLYTSLHIKISSGFKLLFLAASYNARIAVLLCPGSHYTINLTFPQKRFWCS